MMVVVLSQVWGDWLRRTGYESDMDYPKFYQHDWQAVKNFCDKNA